MGVLDPDEIDRLKLQMQQVANIDDVEKVFGPADDRPADLLESQIPQNARHLRKVYRYWRYWNTLAVDIGVWSDSGELGYAYYPRPKKMRKARLSERSQE